VYVSFDDGDHWQSLQQNLPVTSVRDAVIKDNDLVISTYGRGFWIMDDIGALRELTPTVLAQDAHLFTVHPAYRFRPITAPSTTYDDPTTGENPKYGAAIDYYLKAPVKGDVKLTILDAQGQVVRTLTGTDSTGINRIYWDLRYKPSAEVRLYTPPMYADYMMVGPKGREAPETDQLRILAPPGTYTVKLDAGGVEQTQPLVVLKDPNSGGSDAEIAEQMRALFALRDDLDAAADAVHRIETARTQLDALERVVADSAVKKAADTLEQHLVSSEMHFVDLRLTGHGQDGVRFASKLISTLGYLADEIGSSDYRPTNQQEQVRQLLHRELGTQLAALDTLLSKELVAFNTMLRQRNVPNVIVGGRAADGGAR